MTQAGRIRSDAVEGRPRSHLGSVPTPLTLGFVILMAAASPLATMMLTPVGSADATDFGSKQPILCVRDALPAAADATRISEIAGNCFVRATGTRADPGSDCRTVPKCSALPRRP